MTSRGKLHPTPIPSLLLCRDIYCDERTRETIRIGPRSMYLVTELPATIVMSASLFVGGGHGHYHIGLSLRDGNDDEVWGFDPPGPVEHVDPLLPHQVTLFDLEITVREAGRHSMVVSINGDEALRSPFVVILPDG